MKVAAAAALALAGCTVFDGTRDCGGTPALHVVFDLSGPWCEHLTTWGVQVHIGNVTLDPSTATSAHESFGPRRMEYTWAWPRGVQTNEAVWISLFGTGEARTTGSGDLTIAAQPDTCQTVTVPIGCATDVPDAQLAEAP